LTVRNATCDLARDNANPSKDVLLGIQRGVKRDVRTLFDADGNHVPIHCLTAHEAAIIAGFEYIIKNAQAGDGITDTVLKVKLESREKLLELGAKYFGLLQERVEVDGSDELIALSRGRATRHPAWSPPRRAHVVRC
jgi:hypothetical protein